MKNLVLVSTVGDVPVRLRNMLYIVSANSWQEAILFLSGKKNDIAMFWGRDVPVDRLLKSVESFSGNLLVYSEVDVSPVMRSRFSRVMRGRGPVLWREVSKPSNMEFLLDRVKTSIWSGYAKSAG
jgi:hypothetical protein